MKIYIIFKNVFEYPEIIDVFSSKEIAKNYIVKQKNSHLYNIVEWKVKVS